MTTNGQKKELTPVAPAESPVHLGATHEHPAVQEVGKTKETREAAHADARAAEPKPPEPVAPIVPPVAVQAPATVQEDHLVRKIEDILAEDLTDVYLSLPLDAQVAFKSKGEQTASKIHALVQAAKVNAKKIFFLIRDWLKVLPGMNRFFLEQEAKIKTDKILLVSEMERQERKQNDL
ncbi:hypothetical protein HY631_02055 [Candidatus Uhrbacteria bacterium]|nr:hypothetical protein [Candidatus Uhrbacteria bacterium]